MATITPLLSVLEEEAVRAGLLKAKTDLPPDAESRIRWWAACAAASDWSETSSFKDTARAIAEGDMPNLSSRDQLEQWLQEEFQLALMDHAAENDQTEEQALDGEFQVDWLTTQTADLMAFFGFDPDPGYVP